MRLRTLGFPQSGRISFRAALHLCTWIPRFARSILSARVAKRLSMIGVDGTICVFQRDRWNGLRTLGFPTGRIDFPSILHLRMRIRRFSPRTLGANLSPV